MPKVSNYRTTINGEFALLSIGYNKKRKFHFIDFPADIKRLFHFVDWGYETENELCDCAKEVIDKYHALKKKERKIIAISVHIPTYMVMNKVAKGSYSGRNSKLPRDLYYKVKGNGEDGFGFFIEAENLIEIEEDGYKYFDLNEDGKIRWEIREDVRKERIVIDWTPEREEFFKQLEASAELMVMKILNFLADSEKMVQLIDAGNIKLLSI